MHFKQSGLTETDSNFIMEIVINGLQISDIEAMSKASDFRALALSTKIPVTWMPNDDRT